MAGSGASAARWTTTGQVILTGWVPGGLGVFFSSDHTTFTPLRAPLLAADPGEWKRPAPSEHVFYPVILDARNGTNQLSDSWMMVHAYIQPNEGSDRKYFVFREVTVVVSRTPVATQVGVLLARSRNVALHDRWSTTTSVRGNDASYKLEAHLGLSHDRSTLRRCVDRTGGLRQRSARAPGPSVGQEGLLRSPRLSTPAHGGLGLRGTEA